MLPTGRHAKDLFLGTKDSAGLLESLSPETTVLDCSTIDATTSRQIAAAAAQRGLGFLDAPVSGGESPLHMEFSFDQLLLEVAHFVRISRTSHFGISRTSW